MRFVLLALALPVVMAIGCGIDDGMMTAAEVYALDAGEGGIDAEVDAVVDAEVDAEAGAPDANAQVCFCATGDPEEPTKACPECDNEPNVEKCQDHDAACQAAGGVACTTGY